MVSNDKGCNIYNKQNQLIASANLVDQLYKLNLEESNLVAGLAGLAVSGEVWHRRFGHLNYSDLSLMKNGLVNGLECKGSLVKSDYNLCEVC